MRNMEHYSGFVMPSKWFKSNMILGKVIQNGWIVTGFKPWYLCDNLSDNRKIRSEAFLFESTTHLPNVQPESIRSSNLISAKNLTNLRKIFPLFNVCQLSFHNTAISIIKELVPNVADKKERKFLKNALSRHMELKDNMVTPVTSELSSLITGIRSLPLSAPKSE